MPIEVKKLTHVYMPGTPFEAKALNAVSLSIQDGEFVGIIGHTGSGKSTLIQHLNGLLKPTSGQVLYNGQDITRLPAYKRSGLGIGYVPEDRLYTEKEKQLDK